MCILLSAQHTLLQSLLPALQALDNCLRHQKDLETVMGSHLRSLFIVFDLIREVEDYGLKIELCNSILSIIKHIIANNEIAAAIAKNKLIQYLYARRFRFFVLFLSGLRNRKFDFLWLKLCNRSRWSCWCKNIRDPTWFRPFLGQKTANNGHFRSFSTLIALFRASNNPQNVCTYFQRFV